MVLLDKFGRPFLKLRIVVNDVCNFSCIFCHFEGQPRVVGPKLNADDYGFLAETLAKIGVYDFKLTGGEPLLRADIVDIVRRMKRGSVKISMTTNGFRLAELARELASAGLDRANVSLHVADPDKFSKVTNTPRGWYKRVLEGIDVAHQAGIDIKINAVILRGINDDGSSLKSLVKLASSVGASLQLIELMPVGSGAKIFNELYSPAENMIAHLLNMGARPMYTRKDLHNRPVFYVGGVKVEIVKNWNNPYFCAGCTTMRLTSDGKLKPCLYREPAADLYRPIKERNAEALIREVARVVYLREPTFKLSYSSL
ncbi:GTP 3',8-cyclase MoaA [Thermoproteus tenax]|uniref:Probable GTP 3',8-cyclase n=1 Tax=Thermoproteus tenax (strain ATCC 35583 / DSM 2078 / JCM 9277 / NBRC 100435 / Kra 1) TaxID=768679 RepID=G4RLT3_THETK|nr:GTP 3',8-cyclase MoaA [Thermoproteus tenax]CCC82528.1 putative molybdopterin cofactor synthesis protein A [Thermoproteus tenax Kra 1]